MEKDAPNEDLPVGNHAAQGDFDARGGGSASLPGTPLIIPRSGHSVSRADISENALKVLYRLKQAGHQGLLVGGGVRDLLLGHEPKDFDVATDATPEQVRGVFRNCRLIGRRFRLAHVHFGRDIIEVATFRGSGSSDGEADADRQIENGMIVRDNQYGTIEEDALRRDFTVNALYYNIADFSLVDYAGGLEDLHAGRLRLIGDDPYARYREDPVRMLRAVRFACKLGFTIEPTCEEAIRQAAPLLREIPSARLFEETLKLFHYGTALAAFEKLRHYDLFEHLFPETEDCLGHEEHDFPLTFVGHGLANTDRRIGEAKPVNPAFLFAVLLWEPVRLRWNDLRERGKQPVEAMIRAAGEVCARQQPLVAIPKRFSLPMREIWTLQPRFEQRKGKRPQRLATHPRFRAAYDFLVLRAACGEADKELAEWWTRFEEKRAESGIPPSEDKPSTRPRRRRRRRKPRSGGSGDGGETPAV